MEIKFKDKTYLLKDKRYILTNEISKGLCTGCVATHDESLCDTLRLHADCYNKNGIFIEVQETDKSNEPEELFTKSEVKQLVNMYDSQSELTIDELLVKFIKNRKLKNDPEYQKYLELKQKFAELESL